MHEISDIDSDQYGEYVDVTISGVVQRMRRIRAGKFMMGSPENEPNRDDDETLHEVTITQDFWLADTACTQELWEAVMGSNPSRFKGAKRPVEKVTWHDCKKFLGKLDGFRLPTEAEWEYACRAGTTTPYRFGDSITPEQANYGSNREEAVAVKSFPCNAWGLYEMHGNVWEWCSDWHGEYRGDAIDPAGPEVGSLRVLRGGSWFYYARFARSAFRGRRDPDFRFGNTGFRLARGYMEMAGKGEWWCRTGAAEQVGQAPWERTTVTIDGVRYKLVPLEN